MLFYCYRQRWIQLTIIITISKKVNFEYFDFSETSTEVRSFLWRKKYWACPFLVHKTSKLLWLCVVLTLKDYCRSEIDLDVLMIKIRFIYFSICIYNSGFSVFLKTLQIRVLLNLTIDRRFSIDLVFAYHFTTSITESCLFKSYLVHWKTLLICLFETKWIINRLTD